MFFSVNLSESYKWKALLYKIKQLKSCQENQDIFWKTKNGYMHSFLASCVINTDFIIKNKNYQTIVDQVQKCTTCRVKLNKAITMVDSYLLSLLLRQMNQLADMPFKMFVFNFHSMTIHNSLFKCYMFLYKHFWYMCLYSFYQLL